MTTPTPSVTPTRTYLLLEERLGADLRLFVAAGRLSGKSWRVIALDLHQTTGIDVTPQTLVNWFGPIAKGEAA